MATLGPFWALFALLVLLPIGIVGWLSFHSYDQLGPPVAVGLDNYVTALNDDPLFWKSMGNTARFVLLALPLNLLLSLPIALGLRAITRRGTWIRLAFFAPITVSAVAVALLWLPVYDPTSGWLNSALRAVGLSGVSWLGDPQTALWAVMVAAVWQDLPYNIIILLAGLQAIPDELYEAAALDGAAGWQRFRRITLPLLQPTIAFVLVLTAIAYLQQFTHVQVMTGGSSVPGGPVDSTRTTVLHIYDRAFSGFELGYASAMSIILLAVLGLITVVQLRVLRRRWEY